MSRDGLRDSQAAVVVAEDVACGPQLRAAPIDVVKEWVRSCSNRDTLLDGRFVDAGVRIASRAEA